MRNRCFIAIALGLVILFPQAKLRAQIQSGALVSFVATNNADDHDINTTFKRFSPFHTTRERLFFDAPLSDHNSLFVQLLIDNTVVSLYGAYARFDNVYSHYLNLQVGFIPTTVGTFAARTYSNVNPLIGTPLLYNFHTSLVPSEGKSVGTIEDVIGRRSSRTPSGLPVIYDACWNSGVEVYGNLGEFHYSVAALAGSVTKPYQQQEKDLPQFSTHLSYLFGPELIVGASAYLGPYLHEAATTDPVPEGKSFEDYDNGGIGYDLYFARGYFEFNSEAYYSWWEYPTLPDLGATVGYVESKYKFAVGWHVAGRFGWFEPSEVNVANGDRHRWDYSVNRYEVGIGHQFTRSVQTKLVGQFNRFKGAPSLNSDIVALQLSVSVD